MNSNQAINHRWKNRLCCNSMIQLALDNGRMKFLGRILEELFLQCQLEMVGTSKKSYGTQPLNSDRVSLFPSKLFAPENTTPFFARLPSYFAFLVLSVLGKKRTPRSFEAREFVQRSYSRAFDRGALHCLKFGSSSEKAKWTEESISLFLNFAYTQSRSASRVSCG